MVNIDCIMELLDDRKPECDQLIGRDLAKQVQCLSAFMQPANYFTWENCARILIERTDDELAFYLPQLLYWIIDMNHPGGWLIYERLIQWKDKDQLSFPCKVSKQIASCLNEEQWMANILDVERGCMRDS